MAGHDCALRSRTRTAQAVPTMGNGMSKLSRRAATIMMASASCALAAPRIVRAQTRQKVPFAMGAGAFYFTLHYVSEAGGLYAKEGYDLDSVNVSSGPRQVASIMGGSADVAPLGLQLVVQAAQRGGNIIAVCAGYNSFAVYIALSRCASPKHHHRHSM